MIRPPSLRSLLSIACASLVAASAWATTALYATLPELSQLSTAVVVGTIGPARVVLDEQIHRPRTVTAVQVDEVLVGKAGARLEIDQIGGTIRGRTTRVPGDATLEQGERVVLFVREVEGRTYLTALEQSVFRVVADPQGDRVERDLGDGIVVRAPSGELLPYDEAAAPVRTLAELRAIVRAAGVRGGAR